MIVNDGVIEKMFVETEQPGDPFGVSDADTMLKSLNIEIPKSVTIFTRPGCSFCSKAKALLTEKKVDFEELTLNHEFSIKTLKAISGGTSVPQIFIDGEKIGGADELEALYK